MTVEPKTFEAGYLPAILPANAASGSMSAADVLKHYGAVATVSVEKPTNPKDAIGVDKAPLSCVPLGVVAELGIAMMEGACKYGKANYRGTGVRASVYFDATIRHLFSWHEGEDYDPDSAAKLHHVTKAIASLTVLRDAMIQGMCEDDRPPRSASFYARLNDDAKAIRAQYADKSPKHWTIADSSTGY